MAVSVAHLPRSQRLPCRAARDEGGATPVWWRYLASTLLTCTGDPGGTSYSVSDAPGLSPGVCFRRGRGLYCLTFIVRRLKQFWPARAESSEPLNLISR